MDTPKIIHMSQIYEKSLATMKLWSDKRSFVFILFMLIFIARFLFLSADPPLNTHHHFFTDEGWKTRNARNYVLFDKWIMDNHNNIYNSPLHHLATYASFKIFGTGLIQARLVSAISGSLTIIFLYLLVKKGWNRKGAILSTCLAGFSFVFTTYHRLALQETMILFFIVLTVYFWQMGKDNKWFYIFSGFSILFAYLTKPNGIVIAPVVVALYIFENEFQTKDKAVNNKSAIIYFIMGMLPIFLLWHLFSAYLFGVSTSSNPLIYAGNVSSSLLDSFRFIAIFPTSPVFGQMPVLTTLSLVYILYIICSVKNSPRSFLSRMSSLEFVSMSWFIIGCVFIAVMHHQPDRRYLILIPPMSILSAKALMELNSISPKALFEGYKKDNGYWYIQLLSYMMLLIPAYFLLSHGIVTGTKVLNLLGGWNVYLTLGQSGLISIIILLLTSGFLMDGNLKSQMFIKLRQLLIVFLFVYFFSFLTLTHWIVQISREFDISSGVERGLYFGSAILVTCFLILAVTLSIYIIKLIKKQTINSFGLKLSRKTAVVIVTVFILINGYSYLSWAKDMSFTMIDTSRKLIQYVDADTTIVGGIADTLSIETDAYAISYFWEKNVQPKFTNPIEKFQPDFALIKRFQDGEWKPIPEYLSGTKLKRMERFNVLPTKKAGEYRYIVDLYKIEK